MERSTTQVAYMDYPKWLHRQMGGRSPPPVSPDSGRAIPFPFERPRSPYQDGAISGPPEGGRTMHMVRLSFGHRARPLCSLLLDVAHHSRVRSLQHWQGHGGSTANSPMTPLLTSLLRQRASVIYGAIITAFDNAGPRVSQQSHQWWGAIA